MNYSVIGGADGPTSIFLAGRTEPDLINIFGLILVVLLLIPNIIYAIKFRDRENKCGNKFMNVLEQIGRYASMIFMIFNIGIMELGFTSIGAFLLYGLGNIFLMLLYWCVWMLFFHKQDSWNMIALAIIPTCLFVLSGVTLGHIPLMVSGVIFGIGHIYVTYQNL